MAISTAPNRIGILSGTFDPIHDGHLALAEAARHQLGLEEVWILVNGQPEHKQRVTAFSHRLAMARLAVDPLTGVEADREPIQRENQMHSIVTAKQLVHDYPNTQFTLLMGADVFSQIDQWDDYAELFQLVSFGVAERASGDAAGVADLLKRLGPATKTLHYETIAMPRLPVSSATIRAEIAGRHTADGIPPAVLAYARQHHLYDAR